MGRPTQCNPCCGGGGGGGGGGGNSFCYHPCDNAPFNDYIVKFTRTNPNDIAALSYKYYDGANYTWPSNSCFYCISDFSVFDGFLATSVAWNCGPLQKLIYIPKCPNSSYEYFLVRDGAYPETWTMSNASNIEIINVAERHSNCTWSICGWHWWYFDIFAKCICVNIGFTSSFTMRYKDCSGNYISVATELLQGVPYGNLQICVSDFSIFSAYNICGSSPFGGNFFDAWCDIEQSPDHCFWHWWALGRINIPTDVIEILSGDAYIQQIEGVCEWHPNTPQCIKDGYPNNCGGGGGGGGGGLGL